MKKFISMVMAAAMVVSLVPATAFAANAATFKVVDAVEVDEDDAEGLKDGAAAKGAEVQITVKDVDANTKAVDKYEITLEYDGMEALADKAAGTSTAVAVYRDGAPITTNFTVTFDAYDKDDTSITYTIKENDAATQLDEGDVIVIDCGSSNWGLTSDNAGHEATVTVTGDFGDSDAMTLVSVLEYGIKVTLKKVAEVAVEESTYLEKELKIESVVDTFEDGQKFTLKLTSGFEFDEVAVGDTLAGGLLEVEEVDENEMTVVYVEGDEATDTITIAKNDFKVEAVDAEAGDVCEIVVSAKKGEVSDEKVGFADKAEAVEAVVVIADTVKVSVDEDEDVPVYYSGVNKSNDGINETDDHISLVVTMEESVEDAWDLKDAFEINLPEGVYVVGMPAADLKVEGIKANNAETVAKVFEKAYDKGDFESFDFARKAFAENDENGNKISKLEFSLELVADPGFVGPVVLEVVVGGETTEVTVAEFVTPYTVEAAQNDVIIDYRHTAVSDIVVKEAEAGLWDKDLTVAFSIERLGAKALENDVDVDVNEESDMEVKEAKAGFKVTKESDDEAAVVTLSNVSLYMDRTIAAGAYDLVMDYTTAATDEDNDGKVIAGTYGVDTLLGSTETVADVTDADGVVKEAYINVITAGRDQDDASFTKKVVVPVGESYIVAGEDTVALDVPAYVSASGYTMLPVRAVAVALGINTNNVLWDQATKTVTILYGQRIITMAVGSKVINVNGSAIPASASVEVVNGRTFLPMRDLATALGVVDITWDAATKTATLNGNK